MAVAPDEQDWLANNWRILRRMLARLFDHLIEPISNDIVRNGKVSDGDWNVLMNQALKTLAEKAPTSPMHGFAMSLLGDGQTLRSAIEESMRGCATPIPNGLRRTIVVRGLTRCRDVRLAGSAHRGKTWSRIDRISRSIWQARLAKGADLPSGGRCSDDHLVELARELRKDLPGRTGLPTSLTALRKYFHDYCPDCQHGQIEDDSELEWCADDHIALLPDPNLRASFLKLCLEELPEEQLGYALAWSGMDERYDGNVMAYCRDTGTSRDRLNRELRKVWAKLRDCIAAREDDVLPGPRVASAWQGISLWQIDGAANDGDDEDAGDLGA
jgi:hypothetical protein